MRLMITSLLWISLTAGAAVAEGPKSISLFNGKCLEGWTHTLVDKDVKMEDVWSVKDGILVCKGEPLGFLATKKSYKNYQLKVVWRWAPGKKPGNSGVLLRIASEAETFMPRCVEAQLKSGSAGDIWAFIGANIKNDSDRYREIKGNAALGDFAGVGKIKAAEKEPGEWNTYDITFQGDKLTLKVNGELVNKASGCDVVAGPIGLQSEGAEIHFREVELIPLDD